MSSFVKWKQVHDGTRTSKCGRFRIWKSDAVRRYNGSTRPAYYNVYTLDSRGDWQFVTSRMHLKHAKLAAFEELSRQWDREPTPGPWIVTSIKDTPDSLTVGGGDGSEVVAKISDHWPEPTVEGNANLVAAAPDLLAALKEVCDLPNKHRPQRVWDAAKAAIAKAGGFNHGS